MRYRGRYLEYTLFGVATLPSVFMLARRPIDRYDIDYATTGVPLIMRLLGSGFVYLEAIWIFAMFLSITVKLIRWNED